MDNSAIKPAISPATNPYLNRSSIVRRLFYRRISDLLNLVPQNRRARVIDIGCWTGHALPLLAERFGEVWGLDDDSSSLTDHVLPRAQEHCESARLVKADAANSPFPDAYFDIVFLIDTLPYIASGKKPQVVQECLRTLHQTGEMIISLPIELGPVLLLREFGRYWSNSWRDGYSWGALFSAACFTHSQQRNSVVPKNLQGYDYRNDVALLASMMRIEAIRYSPFRFAHGLNPFVLLRCVK